MLWEVFFFQLFLAYILPYIHFASVRFRKEDTFFKRNYEYFLKYPSFTNNFYYQLQLINDIKFLLIMTISWSKYIAWQKGVAYFVPLIKISYTWVVQLQIRLILLLEEDELSTSSWDIFVQLSDGYILLSISLTWMLPFLCENLC